jgi:hypothetical protein
VDSALQGKNDDYYYNNTNKGPISRYYTCTNSDKYESIPDNYLPLALKIIKLFRKRDKKDPVSSPENP